MTKRRSILVAGAAAAALGCSAAIVMASSWMSGRDLAEAFAGQTIDGYYVDGTKFSESYGHDGAIDYREPNRRMIGTWSVVADTFCTIYSTMPTGGCFRVTRTSVNCYEFYFQARTEAEAAAPDRGRPSWTARAWRKDRPSSCAEAPTV
jgi:hypothetical protein